MVSGRLIRGPRVRAPSMKLQTVLFAVTIVAAALSGCADNGATPTPTPAATTPVATTPTATASVTPTPTTETPGDDGEMPPVDPRCLAPPTAPMNVSSGTRLGMPELSFTTSDPTAEDPCYRFHGPQNATSGWNVFELTYPAGGRTFHIMPMYFIGERTIGEVQAAMGPQGAPEWAIPSGAVGGVTPGSTGSVAIDLQAGNYVYFCPIEGHMFQGMMGMLSVTESDNESAEPVADATITLTDYNFTIPELHEDMDVIRVTNNGSEPHEAPLVRLAGGANMTTFIAALEGPNATGPPPGQLIGGVNAIASGQTVYLLVDLAGDQDYGMICFVSSPAHQGMPHFLIGPMVADFTVEHAEGESH